MQLKRWLGYTGVLAGLVLLLSLPAQAQVKAGDSVGNLEFPAPLSGEDAKYLGVAPDKPFRLSDLNAPYLLLEAFATSCSHCFHQAPGLNKLFDLIQQDPKLAAKVRILGVGGGDNRFAIMMWKRQLQVPFPLLPDLDLKVINKLNILGTPTTILLDRQGKVLLAHAGVFEDVHGFFKEIQALVK